MTDQAEVMQAIITEAHALYTQPRQIAAYVVQQLEALRGSGADWIDAQLAAFAVDGCMKRCSSWRALKRTLMRTRKGKTAEVPAWAGVAVRTVEGVEYQQLPFDDLSADQVADSIARMGKQRDTLSVNISVRRQVLEYMRANPACDRAGDAVRALGIAA